MEYIHSNKEDLLRTELVRIARLIDQRGWTPAYAGNFSARIDDTWILTTPAGAAKGSLRPEDLVVVDGAGKPRDPAAPPASTELDLHLTAYRLRPDVQAVVHAHPPLAIACTVAGLSLEPAVLPEIIMTVGRIPTVPYAMTGTPALGAAAAAWIEHHDAMLLDHHGSLALGRTPDEAFQRTLLIEHAALIFITANDLGAIRRLRRADVDDLLAVRRARGGPQESEPPR